MFHDPEDGGVYWVVALDGGRTAVLTDDTEDHVVHMEGLWPFKAVLLDPDRVRTEIDYSIDELTARVVTWCTEAAGSPAGTGGPSAHGAVRSGVAEVTHEVPCDEAVNSDYVVLDCRRPFEERLGEIVRLWVGGGRGRDHLLTGKAFFAVYSWHLGHRAHRDNAWAAFVAAAYDSIGGDDGWETMLRERAVCGGCGDRYRLGNIGLCTGCMRYTCCGCGTHGSCAGETL
ncbi:hypothetical protein ACIQ9P_32355 [Kitasatospora sp. NPDC094019]|uniref:hypothetical protein n=1 Tax=Kitasatospora sp. NPDC094019 TaxID=3364091 RepID=UPI003829A191